MFEISVIWVRAGPIRSENSLDTKTFEGEFKEFK